MKYIVHDGEIEITGASELSLTATFECGQCFRWNSDENGVYTGVAFGRVASLRHEGGSVFLASSEEDFNAVWRGYFDLDSDYAEIRRLVSVNEHMRLAAQFGTGIRILRQDRWEALCSFIISQCNNIPRIKSIIEKLCELYGSGTSGSLHAFPGAERLAGLTEAELAPLRTGYRAKYIIGAAEAVASGSVRLEELEKLTPDEARHELKRLPGVGDKVAQCTALFGLHMLDAFPVDTWMKKAIKNHFAGGLDPKVFSPYAGVAQQYMFYYERSGPSRNDSGR